MFKSLTFDNVNSLDYGVHINGEGVYNAPERDVEMIAIPGRNGEYALDHGRFNNIEVTYPAGIGEMSQEGFADKLKAFRNQLASRRGYCRLEDDYHPDEFRMGVYKSGLEASPVMYNRAGEFDLVFNCKPQRFLKSGEERTEFTESGTVTNPTLFESKPLLELYGYGTLNVNGSEIELHNESPGVIQLADSKAGSDTVVQNFVTNEYYSGDTITHEGFTASLSFSLSAVASNPNISQGRGDLTPSNMDAQLSNDGMTLYIGVTFANPIECEAGMASIKYRYVTVTYTLGGSTRTIELYFDWRYRPGSKDFRTTMSVPSYPPTTSSLRTQQVIAFKATVDSTYLPLGFPLYLDCEIGEAYKEEDGEIILINKNIEIPSDLPVLSPGENQITMDSTYTKVNVIPRWWSV